MIGAIIGDMVGSIYEFHNIKTKDFPLFSEGCGYTDDTLMSVAVARALQAAGDGEALSAALVREMRVTAARYPISPLLGGYGRAFHKWLVKGRYVAIPKPYNSFGNGSAMRVSPCAEYANTLEQALRLAEVSAAVSHNHPEGIKGAQATAAAVWMAGHGASKAEIGDYIRQHYYPLTGTVDALRPVYKMDGSCQGTVPPAILCFLESASFEDALRNAISLGGDSDTLADIACAIAWPYYARQGMDDTMHSLREKALSKLPPALRSFVGDWENTYGIYGGAQ